MAGRLQGKVAIISGGASGCGAAAARLFAAEGAAVGIIDRNADLGQALAAELTNAGHRAVFAAADVSQKAQVEAAVAYVAQALGPVNVLFNHAGTIAVSYTHLDVYKRQARGMARIGGGAVARSAVGDHAGRGLYARL